LAKALKARRLRYRWAFRRFMETIKQIKKGETKPYPGHQSGLHGRIIFFTNAHGDTILFSH
jgi:hypothetical protein